ncbi:MAG: TonB-dependent receptor [Burkholderiaceae bacterium]
MFGFAANPSRRRWVGACLVGTGAVVASAAQCQTSQVGQTSLDPVIVTGTRVERAAFDVPASIDRIDGSTVRDGRLQVNLSESVGSVPGLVARDRQNYAQDVQLSVRGFGARSSFGVRGVRLYVDDIPATLPVGQGQITNVDLSSVDRIEVLRGPFSALYGNSSGGVVSIYTEDGSTPGTITPNFAVGSNHTARVGLKYSSAIDGVDAVLDVNRFTTQGYRDHSAAQRNLGNAKITLRLDDASTLKLVVNSVSLGKADDPLGLTRAAFLADPRSVDASALLYNTRKSMDQTQAGAVYTRRIDDVSTVRAVVYDGHRNTIQFQAIPVAAERSPLSAGGVIALARDYHGVDLRWTGQFREAPLGELTLVAGVAYDWLNEKRFGYLNYIGSTLGVQGALRRNETNDVNDADVYVQGSWKIAPQWSVDLGARRSVVHFESSDHFVTASNPDDSGRVRYGAVTPVAGIVYAPLDDLRLYVSAGRGFETPTLNELSYRPDGASGLNFALQPVRSKNFEAGVKVRSAWLGTVTAAAFQTRTTDELATVSNLGGRATFQNVGDTRRNGLELSLRRDLFEAARLQLAYTLLDATYRDGFLTCTATPCAQPTRIVAAGNSIPGIARSSFYGELAWSPPTGWRAAIEARASNRVFVDDINSDAAPGYAIGSVRAGYVLRADRWTVTGFARVDNLFDRHYAGSVIINESNARFFEPAPGRTYTVGLSASIGL